MTLPARAVAIGAPPLKKLSRKLLVSSSAQALLLLYGSWPPSRSASSNGRRAP